jgi:hypothetical protein
MRHVPERVGVVATPAQIEQRRQAALSLHKKRDSKEIAAKARQGLILRRLRQEAPGLADQYAALLKAQDREGAR